VILERIVDATRLRNVKLLCHGRRSLKLVIREKRG
jgi:hypothetical protein